MTCTTFSLLETTIVSGVARGVVLSTAKNTEFGRIVSLSGEAHEPMSSLERDINNTARLNFLLADLCKSNLLFGGLCFLLG